MPEKRRRGHGEGTINHRKDGRWEGKVDLGWHNGRRRRKSIYGKTYGEVRDKMRQVLKDQADGLPVSVERQTVAQFLQHWLENTVKPSRSPKTYTSYEQLVRLHITPALGKIQLQKLSPQQVQTFLNEKLASSLSPRSVQYIHATLRAALNQAERWGLIGRNVARLVDPPQAKRYKIAPLSPEDARKLLAAASEHRLSALFSVAVAVGLRQGEALGLRWDDVDFDTRTLGVRHQLQRINGKPQLVEPKSEQSRRTVALPDPVVRALRLHRQEQLEERLAAGAEWSDWNLVFCSQHGTPLDDANVRRVFRRLLEKAGLEPIRYHDLRHTCASLLLAQNVHPRVVMETLGHSQISLTMDTYSHVAPALQREAADRMNGLFDAAQEG